MAFVATELRRDVAWKWVESEGECKPVEGGDGVKRGTAGVSGRREAEWES